MNRVLSRSLLALGLVLSACQAAHAPAAVRMVEPPGDSKQWHFEPASIAIKVGDLVTWTNTGTEAHTVTADDNRTFDSPVVNPGETYKQTFAQAGRYPYHCSFHRWMTGTVTVGA